MKLRQDFSPSIRNILFDMGNVLIDLDVKRTLDAFGRLGIGGFDLKDIHPYTTGFFLEYELGNLSSGAFIRAIREKYDCSRITDEMLWDAWNALLLDADMARFELLEEVGRDYRIFVLSNTNAEHIEYVKREFRQASGGREFESYFEKCFYSQDLHLRKPDVRIYREAIRQAGIVPEETLFIDDNACNLPGALDAGLHTYHLTGGEKIFDLFR